MNKMWAAIVVTVFLPTVTLAESPLAAAAKRERERRERNKNEGVTSRRVITQDDVKTHDDTTDEPNAAPSTTTAATAATPIAPPMPDPSYSSAPTNTSRPDAQYWRSRTRAAQARVETARKQLERLPAVKASKGCVPMIKENPTYVEAEAELKAAEQALADLAEEGRRKGALPGWLR
jgi:hypothetical protein